jgi:spermidine/putrescine transport system substrate-binding protein
MSRSVTRRNLLKGLAAGAIAAASPIIIRQPLASSGEVNVFAWGDYIQDKVKGDATL